MMSTADPRLPPDHDVSQLLPPRDEHFCRMLAAGVSLARAVKIAYAGVKEYKNDRTARQRGWQLSKKAPFAARIAYLRTLEQTPEYLPAEPPKEIPPLDLSRGGLISLMSEITSALTEAVRELDKAGAEPRETSRLRSDLLLHVKRLDKAAPPETEDEYSAEDGEGGLDGLVTFAEGMTWCSCAKVDWSER